MSYIYKDKETLLLIKDFLNTLEKNGLHHGTLKQTDVFAFLSAILPKDSQNKNLITGVVNEKGMQPAYFNQGTESIFINLNEILTWLDQSIIHIAPVIEDLNIPKDKIARYLVAFVMAHEVEHSYQYLMGKSIIAAPCQILQIAYKDLYDLLSALNKKISICQQTRRTISRTRYVKDRENFLLERNANIEAYDLLKRFALFNNDEEIHAFFTWLENGFRGVGYVKNTKGCLVHTYKSLLMGDRLRKINSDIDTLSEDEKIRYGLEISKDTRQKVLTKALEYCE